MPAPPTRTRALHFTALASLLALILLCLAWESWLAPLRPGGSLLAAKALPLLFPLPGILRGKLYTYRWAPMLALAYFTEGVVRAWSEPGTSAVLATLEIALALVFFLSSAFYARLAPAPDHKNA